MNQVATKPGQGSSGASKPIGIGQGKPPPKPHGTADDEDERAQWQPGRGATKKKGNPKRSPKASRQR
jgi:hypothetical protein